ncbi:MAG: hypothetical protein LAP85_20405 [Acidobacteriia bacterium]|nr:hypothetical protein [Terriglobia bacterium]
MEFKNLQHHIHTLANLEEADESIVNCYLNLETRYREQFNERIRSLKGGIERPRRPAFWEAIGLIEVFLGTGIRPESKGAAVFCRCGNRPFFLALQFGAPLPNSLTVSSMPHIYHLVALKDNYYVAATLPPFLEFENRECLAVADRLHAETNGCGLVAVGTSSCLKALMEDRASMLVLSNTYAPDPAWLCSSCKEMVIAPGMPRECDACKNQTFQALDTREEIVRLTERNGRPIEIVEHSAGMEAIGGIGCFLRYQALEWFDRPVA